MKATDWKIEVAASGPDRLKQDNLFLKKNTQAIKLAEPRMILISWAEILLNLLKLTFLKSPKIVYT